MINNKAHSILCGGGGYGGKTYEGTMLAGQYLEVEDYSCLVTRHNYAELTGQDSIWENSKKWFCEDVERLEAIGAEPCKVHEGKLRIKSPYGGVIWFKAFDNIRKKQKVKSEGYDRIINDEASELHRKVLQFLYRSLRNARDAFIPLSFINLSNPGSSDPKSDSTDYLCKMYVDGPRPYFWMDWRHNPFIDPEVYSNQLDELDPVDIEYQKHGNWHYRPAKGDLFPEQLLWDTTKKRLPAVQIVRNLRGMDMAITEDGDYTAMVKWLLDNRGHKYIPCVVRRQTEYPEDLLYEVVEKDNPRWEEGIFNTEYYLEKGLAESGVLAKRLIDSVLEEFLDKGLFIDYVPPVNNKFTRARPMGRAWKNHEITMIDQANILGEPWVEEFIEELKDFGPNPKEYGHDDQVDGASVGFNKLDSGGNPFINTKSRYEAAVKKKTVGNHEDRLSFLIRR
jgi:predicted phage terminase large subunit-like protein